MRTAPVITAVVAALCSAQAALAQDVQYPAVPFYDWTGLRRCQYRLRQRHHQRHDDKCRRQHQLEPTDVRRPWRRADRRELPVRAYSVRGRDRRGRHESKHLQRYAHCENVLVRDGAGAARICLRPDSLLRDRRRRIRPVLQFGHHDLACDGHRGLHDGNVAANGVGGGVGSEHAITPNVILRFEFLYLGLLDNSQNSATAIPATSSESVYNLIGRVGLNYKFNWPGS